MASYRIYLLKPDSPSENRLFARAFEADHECDEDALDYARMILTGSEKVDLIGSKEAEVWTGARLVGRVSGERPA